MHVFLLSVEADIVDTCCVEDLFLHLGLARVPWELKVEEAGVCPWKPLVDLELVCFTSLACVAFVVHDWLYKEAEPLLRHSSSFGGIVDWARQKRMNFLFSSWEISCRISQNHTTSLSVLL